MVKSNVTNGKPYTWRHVSTVWGRVLGNRPPQGGYGAGCLAHITTICQEWIGSEKSHTEAS